MVANQDSSSRLSVRKKPDSSLTLRMTISTRTFAGAQDDTGALLRTTSRICHPEGCFIARRIWGVILKAVFMAEESGVGLQDPETRFFADAQNDNQYQVLRRRSGRHPGFAQNDNWGLLGITNT